MITKSCMTEKGFSRLLLPPLRNNKVAEATTIAADSWAWNSLYNAAHVNDQSASIKPTVDLFCGFLNVNTVLEIEVEFMNISGTKAKVAVDSFTNNLYNVGLQNHLIFQSAKSGEFEKVKIVIAAPRSAYYKVIFGTFTADTGEYYVRNCKVTAKQPDVSGETNIKQTIKTGTVRTTAVGVFAKDARFGKDGFTITQATNYIQVVFDEPFTYAVEELRPVTTLSGGSNSINYEILCTNNQNASLTIQFYNRSTGALVDISTIPADMYFSFTTVGSDFY